MYNQFKSEFKLNVCMCIASAFPSMYFQFYELYIFRFNIKIDEYILPLFKIYLGHSSFHSIIKVVIFFMVDHSLHIDGTSALIIYS